MIKLFAIGASSIDLEVNDHVFIPTSTTRLICDQLPDLRGLSVLDLGCGTGVIGLYAASKGAKAVVGIDVMHNACQLAQANAERNGLTNISFRCGSLYEPVKGETFDVIVSDVSGIAELAARNSPWYPPSIPTGGAFGDELALKAIEGSRRHLQASGCFIFPVLSLAKETNILNLAREFYGNNLVLLSEKDYPLPKPLSEKAKLIRELCDAEMISLKRRGSRFTWNLQIYRAYNL
jgi:SAM-dependent methyltransferase